MKKTATKISGNITLILFFVLFLISALTLLSHFKIKFVVDLMTNSQIIQSIASLVSFIFVATPLILLGYAGMQITGDTISLAIAILFCVFSLLMFLWGIKEVTLSKRDDEKFARCKKSCAFMMFTKCMFFVYLLAILVCSVLIDEFSAVTSAYSSLLDVPYIFLIVTGSLTFIAFIIFVLPVSNIAAVASAVKEDRANFSPTEGYVVGGENEINIDDSEEMQNFYSQAPAPTMQANMPPIPGYNPQVASQPIKPQQPQSNDQNLNPQQQAVNATVQPQVNTQPSVQPQVAVASPAQASVAAQPQTVVNNQQPQVAPQSTVQPQQTAQQVNVAQTQPQVANPTVQPAANPQPATPASTPVTNVAAVAPASTTQDQGVDNLTDQGKAELARIDRLKSIGAITEQNYNAMRQKIISSNQKQG